MRVHGQDRDLGSALEAFPSMARATLGGVMDDDFSGFLPQPVVAQLLQDAGYSVPELMLALGTFAGWYAYAPISSFHVGAVSYGGSGAMYFGANLEFEGQALSFCTHAEQGAIANAKYHGETSVQALAISAAPCGYCRQFLYELRVGAGLRIYLKGQNTTLGDLLPAPFGPAELGNRCRLLDPQDHQLTLARGPQDPVTRAALAAANTCYAPYTRDYAGVALQTPGGAIYSGGCEENVAYNPSLSPMEAALVALTMGGSMPSAITRAVLVETPSLSNQQAASRAVLAALAPSITLEVYPATSAETQSCISSS